MKNSNAENGGSVGNDNSLENNYSNEEYRFSENIDSEDFNEDDNSLEDGYTKEEHKFSNSKDKNRYSNEEYKISKNYDSNNSIFENGDFEA